MHKTNLKLFFGIIFFITPVSSKINLVWQASKSHGCETDWVLELLSDIDYQEIEDGTYEKYLDNALIILSPADNKYEAYFEKLHDLGYQFGVIHLSDECYAASRIFYTYAKFVFRNYWHKTFEKQKNVVTFSLGYMRHFWNDNKRVIPVLNERIYNWSFAGQIIHKPTREIMIANLKQVPNHFIHETFTFRGPQDIPVTEYKNILLQTIFVPCPRGYWNMDSFRVAEALECGCIPIVENFPIDYFSNFYGKHPFITISSWDQAPKIIDAFLKQPELLEQRRVACAEWWQNYKIETKKKIKNVINEHLSA